MADNRKSLTLAKELTLQIIQGKLFLLDLANYHQGDIDHEDLPDVISEGSDAFMDLATLPVHWVQLFLQLGVYQDELSFLIEEPKRTVIVN
jgi:hypothetical protein